MELDEAKQYPTHRVALLEMKAKEDLNLNENFFAPGPVERFMRRIMAGSLCGEAPMYPMLTDLCGQPIEPEKLLNRVIHINLNRAAVKFSNPEMVDDVLYADVTPWGPCAGLADERFNEQLRMNAPIRDALSLRMTATKEDNVNTILNIITLDLKSELEILNHGLTKEGDAPL